MSPLIKRFIFWTLIVLFIFHSFLIYTSATAKDNGAARLTERAKTGKLLFQNYNCTACHQLYGLGGYMGPDLTNVISAKGKGELYARAFIQNGTQRMPDFNLTNEEINSLIAYLKYVDGTGTSPIRNFEICPDGTITPK